MRSFAQLAVLAGSANALLVRNNFAKKGDDDVVDSLTKKGDEDVEERRNDARKKYQEASKMMHGDDGMHEQLHSLGATDFLKTSPEAEKSKLAEEYRDIREKAEKKGHKLSHKEAFEMIRGSLSDKEKETLDLVLQQQEGGKSMKAEDEKTMYVKAMQALNDMFLSVDDERIRTVTTCNVELTAM